MKQKEKLYPSLAGLRSGRIYNPYITALKIIPDPDPEKPVNATVRICMGCYDGDRTYSISIDLTNRIYATNLVFEHRSDEGKDCLIRLKKYLTTDKFWKEVDNLVIARYG